MGKAGVAKGSTSTYRLLLEQEKPHILTVPIIRARMDRRMSTPMSSPVRSLDLSSIGLRSRIIDVPGAGFTGGGAGFAGSSTFRVPPLFLFFSKLSASCFHSVRELSSAYITKCGRSACKSFHGLGTNSPTVRGADTSDRWWPA